MSHISKALKKAQELRKHELPKAEDMVPAASAIIKETVADTNEKPQIESAPVMVEVPASQPNHMLLFIGLGISMAVSVIALVMVMSAASNGNKDAERVVKMQNQQINDLKAGLNRTKADLKNIHSQIKGVSAAGDDHYDSLKEALMDDKQEISFLDDETKKLEQKLSDMASKPSAAPEPAATVVATGN